MSLQKKLPDGHTEAWIKWLSFTENIFKWIFFNENLVFSFNFPSFRFVPEDLIGKKICFSFSDGLALKTWTNDVQILWRHIVLLCHNDLSGHDDFRPSQLCCGGKSANIIINSHLPCISGKVNINAWNTDRPTATILFTAKLWGVF